MALNDFILVAPKNDLEAIAIGAEIGFERGLPRLEPGAKQPRSFEEYLNSALSATSEKDLKLRYSGHRLTRGCLVVAVGPTSFHEYREGFGANGDLPDFELIKKLQEEGKTAMHDRWARLARPLGLTAVVMDGKGTLVLGERQGPAVAGGGGVTEYSDLYHSPAGYFAFTTNPNEVNIIDTALYFLRTNYNIQRGSVFQVKPLLIAAHPETGETDIVCLVKTDVDSSHFEGNGLWKDAERSSKYKSLQRISVRDAGSFLASNKVVYGTATLLSHLSNTDGAKVA
ncbi:hypothetical protein HYU20_01095 [Candidatus Woesearchaeota archaeon]|nr:hypothetical protein [Candidatus Woesearchaeota archaeon]